MADKVTLLMKSLNDFYKNESYIKILKPILNQESIISLRILDWFITNYSKKKSIIINNTFDIYQNYKLQLRSYSKKQFDPFCRKNKILFYYNNSDFLETSCGQLCFFRWCIQNGILEYVEKHIDEIENDMKISIKTPKDKNNKEPTKSSIPKKNTIPVAMSDSIDDSTDDSPRRRQTLSVSASRTVSKRKVKYTITFD